MSENNTTASATGADDAEKPFGGARQAGKEPDDEKNFWENWPWYGFLALVLLIMIFVFVLLVGLPILSVMLVQNTIPGSLDATLSFWGATFAAFISLAVTLIAGIFVFMTVKIETGARQEARREAEKTATDIMVRETEKFVAKHGRGIIKETAKEFVNKHGERITTDVAQKEATSIIGNTTETMFNDKIPDIERAIKEKTIEKMEQAAEQAIKENIPEIIDRANKKWFWSIFKKWLKARDKDPDNTPGPGNTGR